MLLARPVRVQNTSVHANAEHASHYEGSSEGTPRAREALVLPVDPTTLMAMFNAF